MKNTEIPAAYQAAIKSGKVEYAELDHSKHTVVRQLNLLKIIEMAGDKISAGGISGAEISRLIDKIETRGISIPGSKLSEAEIRSLADLIKDSGFDPHEELDRRQRDQELRLQNEKYRIS